MYRSFFPIPIKKNDIFFYWLVKYLVTDCYGGNTLCCNTLTVAIVGSLVSDKCMLLCVLAVNGVETSHQACPNSILPKTTQTFVCAYAQSTWDMTMVWLWLIDAGWWWVMGGGKCGYVSRIWVLVDHTTNAADGWVLLSLVCNLVMCLKTDGFASLSNISTIQHKSSNN